MDSVRSLKNEIRSRIKSIQRIEDAVRATATKKFSLDTHVANRHTGLPLEDDLNGDKVINAVDLLLPVTKLSPESPEQLPVSPEGFFENVENVETVETVEPAVSDEMLSTKQQDLTTIPRLNLALDNDSFGVEQFERMIDKVSQANTPSMLKYGESVAPLYIRKEPTLTTGPTSPLNAIPKNLQNSDLKSPRSVDVNGSKEPKTRKRRISRRMLDRPLPAHPPQMSPSIHSSTRISPPTTPSIQSRAASQDSMWSEKTSLAEPGSVLPAQSRQRHDSTVEVGSSQSIHNGQLDMFDLKTRLQHLTMAAAKAHDEIKVLKEQNVMKDNEVTVLKEQDMAKDDEFTVLKEQDMAKEDELRAFKAQNMAKSNEIEVLKEQNMAKDDEIEALKEQSMAKGLEIRQKEGQMRFYRHEWQKMMDMQQQTRHAHANNKVSHRRHFSVVTTPSGFQASSPDAWPGAMATEYI